MRAASPSQVDSDVTAESLYRQQEDVAGKAERADELNRSVGRPDGDPVDDLRDRRTGRVGADDQFEHQCPPSWIRCMAGDATRQSRADRVLIVCGPPPRPAVRFVGMGDQLDVSVLGGLQVAVNGRPLDGLGSAKGRALLAFLAVTRAAHSRSALAGLLWSD